MRLLPFKDDTEMQTLQKCLILEYFKDNLHQQFKKVNFPLHFKKIDYICQINFTK